MQVTINDFEFLGRPSIRPVLHIHRYYHVRLCINGIIIYVSLKDFISASKYYSRFSVQRPNSTTAHGLNSITGNVEFALYGINWAINYLVTIHQRPVYYLFQRHRARFVYRIFNIADIN